MLILMVLTHGVVPLIQIPSVWFCSIILPHGYSTIIVRNEWIADPEYKRTDFCKVLRGVNWVDVSFFCYVTWGIA